MGGGGGGCWSLLMERRHVAQLVQVASEVASATHDYHGYSLGGHIRDAALNFHPHGSNYLVYSSLLQRVVGAGMWPAASTLARLMCS